MAGPQEYYHHMTISQMTEPQRKRRCSLDSIEIAVEQSAKRLGYALLKKEQCPAIRKFVEGNDVLISLPTVNMLKSRGVSAIKITSGDSENDDKKRN